MFKKKIIVWVYTNSVNESLEFLSSNCCICFKFHKHLVAWNWCLNLFVKFSEISYNVCIFTSSIINFDILKSTMKLLSKVKFDAINKYYSSFRIYLNEFKIQNNIGSKIGCNMPAAIDFVEIIGSHQNIFVSI